MSTIPKMLLESAGRCPKPNAFRYKHGEEWIDVSTVDFLSRVEELFYGLKSLGVRVGDRVAILSENRLEWAISDYAVQSLGGIVVPIYTTLSAEQVEHLLLDCEANLVFVSTLELLEKVVTARKRLRELKYLVIYDSNAYQPGVVRLDTLYKIGRDAVVENATEFRDEVARRRADDVATIIYTSGTTGVPKGAMLSHNNLMSNIQATAEILPLSAEDVQLSFLPLSHIFQRHVDYAAFRAGASIAYAENLTTVGANMLEVRPTFAAGVPRFFEKMRSRILSDVEAGPAIRRLVFQWAMRQGFRAVRRGRFGLAHALAERLVFRKIRERLGGRLRFFISGGAALEREVAEFFFAFGLQVLEGYGLTETSPVIALTAPGQAKIGAVGKPVGDMEVKIAEDGEILVRGSGVMKGYFQMPIETGEALRDGWFHTGDIGVLDEDGFLTVTDRKKDLIVTSTGKKVAPQPIENRLKLVPYFENVLLIGDRRSSLSALIVPNITAIETYARNRKIDFATHSDLLRHPEILDLALREIAARTTDLANHERIFRVAFVEKGFTVESGELTPTLKLRRAFIEAAFRKQIDELYAA